LEKSLGKLTIKTLNHVKIQLINPPVSNLYSRPSRAGCFPPLDLLSLASYLKEKNAFCEIEILDGEILSLEEILKRLNADIVGISPKVFSYNPSLEIAQHAAEKGARVILGGAWASSIARNILKNRPFIEVVVRRDGEEALLAFSNNSKYSEIPGIVYRNKKDIISNKQKPLDLNCLPMVDYEYVNIHRYFENYQNKFPEHSFKNPLPIYSQKGCFWYDKSGGCVFCRIQFTHNRRKSPQRFWTEIRYLVKSYGTDLIWDVSDTFTEPEGWVEEIVSNKPSDINCKFYFYGRASDIHEKMAFLLQSLGCFELLIGVESGNDILLQKANKGISKKIIIKAVKLCADHGIQVFPTFLFGLPGEDERSIEETLLFGEELMRFDNIKEISSSILVPLPGSSIYNALCKRMGYPSWLVNNDDLDFARIQNSYVKLFAEVKIEDLLAANAKLSSLVEGNKRSSFGMIKYSTQ
jgi:radical SAM superfamily enzyme YgiQ (UPF0313 family)